MSDRSCRCAAIGTVKSGTRSYDVYFCEHTKERVVLKLDSIGYFYEYTLEELRIFCWETTGSWAKEVLDIIELNNRSKSKAYTEIDPSQYLKIQMKRVIKV